MRRFSLYITTLISVATIFAPPMAFAQTSQSAPATSLLNREDDEQVPLLSNEAQQQLQQPEQSSTPKTNLTGRNAISSAGEAGQRQTRDSAATQAGIKPMMRIASRIQNRVQNRLRNRIDRNFDPRSDPNDPFFVAEEQVTGPRQTR